MANWTAFPYAGDYDFDVATVKRHWARLHAGDLEPMPGDSRALQAWALFHNGEFEKAVDAALKLCDHGITVINKATCVYANYLETNEATKLNLYMEVADRAQAQIESDPDNANAHYWHAYALSRYSQGTSVAKALAQGLGGKVKASLERAIQLQPKHADAHVALGAFHAEVIDKVGTLIGGMTYGAKRDTGLKLFQTALDLHPRSAIAMIEYANGLVMLDGDIRMEEATSLYEKAAASTPLDAMERLDAEMAKRDLAD